jgi:hypothetical protein
VCLPKKVSPMELGEYRPITLLYSDYKFFGRILANSMRRTLSTVIHPSQYCGVPGRTIFDGIAVVRVALAYAQFKKKALCILSLDFQAALDKISHRYLFRILEAYGYPDDLLRVIQAMYGGALSSVQVNGFLSRPFSVRSSIRQGCPMSMLLFILAMNPLLCMLDGHLLGFDAATGSKASMW